MWKEIQVPGTNDITAIQLSANGTQTTIFNIYNDCNNDQTTEKLEAYLNTHSLELRGSEDDHLIWLGDFNRHHSLWDDEAETCLFTT